MVVFPEAVQKYAREQRLSLQDAAQVFLQTIVLKHLSAPRAVFMGGTALVLGYGNPRFSEDVDLTQVSNPLLLKPGLEKSAAEAAAWLNASAKLMAPKPQGRTWRMTLRWGRADSLSLHVDSQVHPAYSSQAILLTYPSIPAFVCMTMGLDEILAEKMLAVAYRRYLGGRDLFDLWFHLSKEPDLKARLSRVEEYTRKKLRDRKLDRTDFEERLQERLSHPGSLTRARQEWARYLPTELQKPALFQSILTFVAKLPEVMCRELG